MRIEANEVLWDVPEDAEGTGVLLCAELADGTLVEHDYFLHVETAQNRIPRPVEIFEVTPTDEGIALNWAGDGPLFQVQRKVSLEDEAWTKHGRILEHQQATGSLRTSSMPILLNAGDSTECWSLAIRLLRLSRVDP